ncbi:MAG: InlB B-repeat-containing protein [Clostridia bacterium]|nr:InlB B-repeat-containing protein [Clostridia bacterium]
MKNKKIRKSISFILTLSFLLSFSIVAAFAAEDKTSMVYIDADSSTGDITEEVGNITVSNDYGAEVYAEEGATATLTSGNVDSHYGVYVGSYGNGSTSNMTINGDATNGEYGIYTDAESGSETNVNVTGSVTNAEYGLYPSYTEYSATTNVNIGGDVTSDYYGIYGYYVYDNSTLNIDIAGDLKSKYDEAIYLEYIESGSKANINIGGDVVSEEDEGVHFHVYDNSVLNLKVGGNIESDSACIDICSLYDGSVFNAEIGGSLIGEGGFYTDDVYDSKVNISVKGDIKGEDYGISSELYDNTSFVDVLVEGTISGKQPIYLEDNAFTLNGTDVTVWKIVPNAAGNVAETYDGSDYVPYRDFEKKIKYIIKLEQPEGATLSATDADGKALAKSHDWDVANEGDRVLLKVDLQKGYKLLGAYNGDGEKLALLKDAAGNYYVDVTKGGGVYLSVELDRETYNVTLDIGEGTLDGHTGLYTFSGKYGDKITLGAPTRAGYRFLYWEGSRYYAGDEYTITENHTLTAVWEKIEDEEVANTDNGMLTHFTAFTDMDTHSGGSIGGGSTDSAGFWLAVVCISMLAAFVGVSYSRKRAKRVHFDV